MRIVATSDVHGHWNTLKIPKCDVLVLAGDILSDVSYLTNSENAENQIEESEKLGKWAKSLLDGVVRKSILMIPGNHDFAFEEKKTLAERSVKPINVIHGKRVSVDGISFYGMSWIQELKGMAFYLPRNKIAAECSKIPCVDVLVTHTPPFGILDEIYGQYNVGSKEILGGVNKTNPKVHIFGHIHASYGETVVDKTRFFNVAYDQYKKHPPKVIDI